MSLALALTIHNKQHGHQKFAVMARHGNAEEANPARLVQYSTFDIRVAFAPAPNPCSCSSLSHAQRSMVFFINQTFALPTDSARPIDYIVSDNRVEFAPVPNPCSCSSLSHAHRSMVFFRNQTCALPADSVIETY